ncbi:MAG: efflux RND transporter periplasmic adaptor subunit [Planctomycetota bacterium]
MNQRNLVGGILATVVLGGGLYLYTGGGAAAATGGDHGPTYTVRRDVLNVTLTENGTLVAKESVKLVFKIRGQGRITSLVPEGQEVAVDDVLCQLDTTESEKDIAQLELDILSAETELKKAKLDLEIQKVENESSIEKAGNAVVKTAKELERYRDGDAPQELRKLQVELKDTETAFNRAKKKYDDSKELLELKYIRQSELEDHRIEFDKAQVAKEGAELAITLFDKYTRPMTLAEKDIAQRDADRELETAQKRAQSQLDQKQVALTQATKKVERYRTRLTEKQEEIENMTLKAPVPGVVIYGDPRYPWNNDEIKIGGRVWQGMTVMTIPDLREMQVKLAIHEADIAKVKNEQTATVTFDTYPGLNLDAEITQVAEIAGGGSSPWERESDVKQFDVEVTIKQQDEIKLKPGISAKVEILIARLDDVLFIPLQCTFLEDGKHWCHVLEDEAVARREIEIGLSSEKYVEVAGGLAEGDEVLLYNPSLPVDTQGDEPDAESDAESTGAPKPEAEPAAEAASATAPAAASSNG